DALLKITKLENFVNFSEIDFDRARALLGFSNESNGNRINQKLWGDREQLASLIENNWNTNLVSAKPSEKEIKLEIVEEKKETLKDIIQSYYKEKKELSEVFIRDKLRPIYEEKYSGVKQEKKEKLSLEEWNKLKEQRRTRSADQRLLDYQNSLKNGIEQK